MLHTSVKHFLHPTPTSHFSYKGGVRYRFMFLFAVSSASFRNLSISSFSSGCLSLSSSHNSASGSSGSFFLLAIYLKFLFFFHHSSHFFIPSVLSSRGSVGSTHISSPVN